MKDRQRISAVTFQIFSHVMRQERLRNEHISNGNLSRSFLFHMVRSIRSCDSCCIRFVSLANNPRCKGCCDELQNSSSSSDKGILSKEAVPQAAEADDKEDDDCSSDSEGSAGGSEGGDEIHCTQLHPEDEDDYEVVPAPNGKENQATTLDITEERPPQEEDIPICSVIGNVTSKDKTMTTECEDICFICGQSLVNLKHRLNHIKRCSKKHSIKGRDVMVDTEADIFVEVEEAATTNKQSTTTILLPPSHNDNNPYTRQSTWHGDASLTLKLAEQTCAPVSNGSISSNTSSTALKQASLNAFLNNPIRNLNNVLLAGARKLTKQAQIKSATLQQKVEKTFSSRGVKRGWGSLSSKQQKGNYSSGCPAYKKISGTDFVCDGFHHAKPGLTKNYFLTHFHSDHYGGITKTWEYGTIYCSLPTAELVTQQLGVDRKYLHPLPMNIPTIVESRGKPITVTLLDANHCPGAVMFLFQVGKRQILHVGDFRWDRDSMLQTGSPLRDFATGKLVLDELYLDTTYCDPKYTLPTQAATVDAIQTVFRKELERCSSNKTAKTLHLFGAYTIGKERMYLSVAEQHNMKVYVDSRRHRIMSVLNWPKERTALLTQNKEEACIWVIPLGDINMKKLPEYLQMANNKPFATPYDRVIGYRPTGWSLGSNPSSSLVSSRYHGNTIIHSVPYSEHSSFPELVDCLACLKPQCTIPTVSVSKSDQQVKMLMKALKEKQTTLHFLKCDNTS